MTGEPNVPTKHQRSFKLRDANRDYVLTFAVVHEAMNYLTRCGKVTTVGSTSFVDFSEGLILIGFPQECQSSSTIASPIEPPKGTRPIWQS